MYTVLNISKKNIESPNLTYYGLDKGLILIHFKIKLCEYIQ